MTVALFIPCYVDQLFPEVGIAALRVLERLGVDVEVPDGAVCCGQPMANAGMASAGDPVLERFVASVASYDRIIVVSGSCAAHVLHSAASMGSHGRQVVNKTVEFCSFLHDDVGLPRVASLGATLS